MAKDIVVLLWVSGIENGTMKKHLQALESSLQNSNSTAS